MKEADIARPRRVNEVCCVRSSYRRVIIDSSRLSVEQYVLPGPYDSR